MDMAILDCLCRGSTSPTLLLDNGLYLRYIRCEFPPILGHAVLSDLSTSCQTKLEFGEEACLSLSAFRSNGALTVFGTLDLVERL